MCVHTLGRCSAACLGLLRWIMERYILTYSVPMVKITIPDTQEGDKTMCHPYYLPIGRKSSGKIQLWLSETVLAVESRMNRTKTLCAEYS